MIGVVAACACAFALAGCALGGASKEDFAADVREARDRVDSALASVTRAQSLEDLFDRMDDASRAVDAAADDLDDAGAPEDLQDEADELVDAFHQLSTDLEATADTIREPAFADVLPGTRGLSFESWTKANRVLGELREQGIDVQPLARH